MLVGGDIAINPRQPVGDPLPHQGDLFVVARHRVELVVEELNLGDRPALEVGRDPVRDGVEVEVEALGDGYAPRSDSWGYRGFFSRT